MSKNKNTTYCISRHIFKSFLKSFFGFNVYGSENLPKKGPFVIASNHVSYIDPVVVGVACHTIPIAFMAKKELFGVPFFGRWFRAVGCIPIERESKNFAPLKRAVEKLRMGKAIGIFPEGTRSTDGKLKKPQPGIGFLAMKTGAPIVPVYVSGTDKAMPKGQKFVRPCRIKARIGRIINPGAFKGADKRGCYEDVGETVMKAIADLKSAEEKNSRIV